MYTWSTVVPCPQMADTSDWILALSPVFWMVHAKAMISLVARARNPMANGSSWARYER